MLGKRTSAIFVTITTIQMATKTFRNNRKNTNFVVYLSSRIGIVYMSCTFYRDTVSIKNTKIWHTRCARWCNNYNFHKNLDKQSWQQLIYIHDCPIYAKIYPTYAQFIPKICQRCFSNRPKICPKGQRWAESPLEWSSVFRQYLEWSRVS